jgi:hypothetical protein
MLEALVGGLVKLASCRANHLGDHERRDAERNQDHQHPREPEKPRVRARRAGDGVVCLEPRLGLAQVPTDEHLKNPLAHPRVDQEPNDEDQRATALPRVPLGVAPIPTEVEGDGHGEDGGDDEHIQDPPRVEIAEDAVELDEILQVDEERVGQMEGTVKEGGLTLRPLRRWKRPSRPPLAIVCCVSIYCRARGVSYISQAHLGRRRYR